VTPPQQGSRIKTAEG